MDLNHSISNGSGTENSNESSCFAGPTLQRSGEQPTIGGASHPNGCTPCAFYCFKRSGCRKGEDCMYCHMSHISKQRQRSDQWKKGQRGKRSNTRAGAPFSQLAQSQASTNEASSACSDDAEAAGRKLQEKPVFYLAVPLQRAKVPLEHTVNAAATAELKQTVPIFCQAPDIKVSAIFPLLKGQQYYWCARNGLTPQWVPFP